MLEAILFSPCGENHLSWLGTLLSGSVGARRLGVVVHFDGSGLLVSPANQVGHASVRRRPRAVTYHGSTYEVTFGALTVCGRLFMAECDRS